MKYFFCIGVFLLPFVVWPWWTIPFEVPRVWFLLIFVEILWVNSLRLFLTKKVSINSTDTLGFILLGLLGVVAVLSSLFGVDLKRSIYGNYYRLDGLITLIHLMGLSIWVAFFFKKSWTSIFLASICASVFLLTLSTIFLAILHPGNEVGGPFGQPNFLGGHLLVSLPAVWCCTQRFPRKYQFRFSIALILLTLLAILLTQSLGALLGVGLFAISTWCFRDKNRLKLLLPAVFVFIFIFLIGAYWKYKDTAVPESRERIVRKLLPAIGARPVLGWGWSNVDAAFQSTVWPMVYQFDIHVDKAHSHVLEWFVTTGVVGGCIYIVLLSYTGRRLFHAQSYFLFTFILFLFHTQTNVISISEEVFFWIVLGIAMQSSRAESVG